MQTHRHILKNKFVACALFCAGFLALGFLSAPFASYAQFETIEQGVLTLRVSPEHPRGGQQITITAEIYSFDQNTATYTWRVNGELVREGRGERHLTLTTGPIGTVQRVSVTATSVQGLSSSAEETIIPAAVEIYTQADTYTPPFYRGKALVSPGANATLIALPNVLNTAGQRVSAGNLVYTWEKNGTVLGKFSGSGKSTLPITAPITGGADRFTVTAATIDGAVAAKQSVVISPTEPELVLYERDPLLGAVLERAIGDIFRIFQGEATLVAQPFFFSAGTAGDNRLRYSWSLDGQPFGEGENSPFATFGTNSEERGASNIRLRASHAESIFQSAERSFRIEFGSAE